MNKTSKLSILGICASIIVMGMIFSMVNISLTNMQKELHATSTQLQWVVNIFGIFTCSTLVIFGRLGDMIGRKKVFLLGSALQGIALLGAGCAFKIHEVIFFQAIAGLSNAIILTISQSLMTHEYDESKRSKAIALWASVVGISLAIGPLLGGALVSAFSWRAVYFAPLPFVVFSFLMVCKFTQESKNTLDEAKLDIPGAILLAITITAFALAVIEGSAWSLVTVITLYAISVIALIALLFAEKKAVQPIIREDLFLNKRFMYASIANCCVIFFIWAALFLWPLYFQKFSGYSAFATGLILLFVTVPMIFLSPSVERLYHKMNVGNILFIGFALLLASALLQLWFHPHSNISLFIITALLLGLAWTITWSPSTIAAVSTLSRERVGIASGTFMTIQEIGGTLGLTITASVVRARSDFLIGFHSGVWVLVIISLVGVGCSVALRRC